jgi:hypothetical protein
VNRTEIGDFVVTGARNQLVCGEGFERRKAWIEERLELLAGKDNHLPLLCRLDPGVAESWTDEEVIRRWIAVYPPRTLDIDDPRVVQM